jgi:hypothetical protein
MRVRVAAGGAGRGIASYALAVDGWSVTTLELDGSTLTGRGAIEQIQAGSGLPINIVGEWGESLPFADNSFDLAYCRRQGRSGLDRGERPYALRRLINIRTCFFCVTSYNIYKVFVFLTRNRMRAMKQTTARAF